MVPTCWYFCLLCSLLTSHVFIFLLTLFSFYILCTRLYFCWNCYWDELNRQFRVTWNTWITFLSFADLHQKKNKVMSCKRCWCINLPSNPNHNCTFIKYGTLLESVGSFDDWFHIQCYNFRCMKLHLKCFYVFCILQIWLVITTWQKRRKEKKLLKYKSKTNKFFYLFRGRYTSQYLTKSLPSLLSNK